MTGPTDDLTEGLGGLGGALKGVGGALSSVFGEGSIAQQFLVWGVLQQVAGAVLAPALAELQQGVFAIAPDLVNSPAQLADLVVRGLLSDASGKNNAAKNGIGGESFEELVDAAGRAPAQGELYALLQRGLIARGAANGKDISFDGALANSGLRPEWVDHLAQLAVQIPSVEQVMDAWLEGQITEGEANTRYLAAGGDPSWFQTSYNANGQAPTPVQALEMLNRGLIPESGTGPDSISYEQAFLEGPWRNKWLPPFRALGIYVPPPRTVTALYKEGRISQAEAIGYLKDAGMTATLAAAYVADATATASSTAKAISESQTIALYEDHLIDRPTAVSELVALKYSAADANLLIELADMKQAAASVKSAVTRLQTLYLAGKNTAAATNLALHTLGLTDDQASQLIAVWDLEHVAQVKTITAAEYTSAVYYAIMSQADATAGLIGLGYSDYEAWLLISLRMRGPQPGWPGGGPAVPAAPVATT